LSLCTPLSGNASVTDKGGRRGASFRGRALATTGERLPRNVHREMPMRCTQHCVVAQAQHIAQLLQLARIPVLQVLEPDARLPDLRVMPEVRELVGIADDLEVEMLLKAYASGLFPIAISARSGSRPGSAACCSSPTSICRSG
jgi:hypothetical protein